MAVGLEFQMGLAELQREAFLRTAAAAGDRALASDLASPRRYWVQPEVTHDVVAASMGVSSEALALYNTRAAARLNVPEQAYL